MSNQKTSRVDSEKSEMSAYEKEKLAKFRSKLPAVAVGSFISGTVLFGFGYLIMIATSAILAAFCVGFLLAFLLTSLVWGHEKDKRSKTAKLRAAHPEPIGTMFEDHYEMVWGGITYQIPWSHMKLKKMTTTVLSFDIGTGRPLEVWRSSLRQQGLEAAFLAKIQFEKDPLSPS